MVWLSALWLTGLHQRSRSTAHRGVQAGIPAARAKQTPTLLVMIIINYGGGRRDRAELPQPEPLPRKTSFSLGEKSLSCLPLRSKG